MVRGTIRTGTYIIQSVFAPGSVVTLRDDSKGSPLVVTESADSDNIKWNISKLSNGRYTILSYGWDNYASVNYPLAAGEVVEGEPDGSQWVITETNNRGEYTISPQSNDSLFWGIENPSDGSKVKLLSDKSNAQWTLIISTT